MKIYYSIFLLSLIGVYACNNRTVIPGENALSLQSCYSQPAKHAIVWAAKETKINMGIEEIRYPLKGAIVNFEAGKIDDKDKVETSIWRELTRQGMNVANPKIRKINQNTFLATWTTVENSGLYARYIQETSSGLMVDEDIIEFTVSAGKTGTILAYDLEIINNSIVIAVHKGDIIEIYAMENPLFPPFPGRIPLIGTISNPYPTRYTHPNICITEGVDNNLISWSNGTDKIT